MSAICCLCSPMGKEYLVHTVLDICRGNVTLAVPILYKSPGNIYVKTLIVTPKVEGGDKGTEVSLFSSSLPQTWMKP